MKKISRKVTEKIKKSNSFHDADFTELSLAQDAPKPLKCTFEHYSARLHEEADSLSKFEANSLKARLWAMHELLMGRNAQTIKNNFLDVCRQDKRQKMARTAFDRAVGESSENCGYDWEEHAYCRLVGAASDAYKVAMLLPCMTPKEINKRQKEITKKAKELVNLLDKLGPWVGPDYRLRELAFLANGTHITTKENEKIPAFRDVLNVVAKFPSSSSFPSTPNLPPRKFGKPSMPSARRTFFIRDMGGGYFDLCFDGKCHELLAEIVEALFPDIKPNVDAVLVSKLRQGHGADWDLIFHQE